MTLAIILPTHLKQNEPYLKAALRAIFWNRTQVDYHVYLLSSAESPPEVKPHERLTITHNPELNTATKKLDYALDHLIPKTTEFVLLHSDDIMLAGDAIQKMVHVAKDVEGIQNPFCNGDIPAKYLAPFYLKDLDGKVHHIPTHTTLEQIEPLELSLQYPPPKDYLVVPFDWVSFYCTMMPYSFFERFGRLDDKLDHKGNDLDYCLRLARHGIRSFVNFGTRCIHFGSKTLSVTKTPEMEQEADLILKERWNLPG